MTTPSARRVHGDLVAALERLCCAEHSAVTLFARVLRDELYRPLGYATIELYGTGGLGLSAAATSRELETRVVQARTRNRRERNRLRRHRRQAALVLSPSEGVPFPSVPPPETPVTVSLDFSPVQHARYEALLERLRKKGCRTSRAVLARDGHRFTHAREGPPSHR